MDEVERSTMRMKTPAQENHLKKESKWALIRSQSNTKSVYIYKILKLLKPSIDAELCVFFGTLRWKQITSRASSNIERKNCNVRCAM